MDRIHVFGSFPGSLSNQVILTPAAITLWLEPASGRLLLRGAAPNSFDFTRGAAIDADLGAPPGRSGGPPQRHHRLHLSPPKPPIRCPG